MRQKLLDGLSVLKTNLLQPGKIVLISESADWVIKDICQEIVAGLNELSPRSARLSYAPWGLRDVLLHFGSINTLARHGRIRPVHSSNRVVLTWYHILEHDPRLPLIPALRTRVDIVHTACTLTERKLLALGFARDQVVRIPESVDCTHFRPVAAEEKKTINRQLGLPLDRVIIGSFQKDGEGMGEGLQPKYIKGPDIFCEVTTQLSRDMPIHVLLTGPARGYVKRRLSEASVPYTHTNLPNPRDVSRYYQALDLYLVTSREEGGPKAILESLASGVPIISTAVGMAPDVLISGSNGLLVAVDDVPALVSGARRILGDSAFAEQLVLRGLETIRSYDRPHIIRRYWQEIYRPLLDKRG